FRRQFPQIQALLLFVQAVKQFPVHFRSFLCFFFSLYHIIKQSHSCKDYFFASPYQFSLRNIHFLQSIIFYVFMRRSKGHTTPLTAAPT
ncbi:MAG: hypothetical protein IJQ81_00570, partial [Oscillibacter sp.]|nr:hypothetical protein [Oscillibacter sp.]